MITEYIHSLLFICKLFQSILLKSNTTCFVFTFHQIIHSRPIKPRGEGVTAVLYAPGTTIIIVLNRETGMYEHWMWCIVTLYTPRHLSYYFYVEKKIRLAFDVKLYSLGTAYNQDNSLRKVRSCLKGFDEFRDREAGQLLLYYLWTRWLSHPLLLRVTSGSLRFCLRPSHSLPPNLTPFQPNTPYQTVTEWLRVDIWIYLSDSH